VDEPNGLVRRHDLAFANRTRRPAHACTSLANGAHTGDHCTGVAPAGLRRANGALGNAITGGLCTCPTPRLMLDPPATAAVTVRDAGSRARDVDPSSGSPALTTTPRHCAAIALSSAPLNSIAGRSPGLRTTIASSWSNDANVLPATGIAFFSKPVP